jgi:hypothetical protein
MTKQNRHKHTGRYAPIYERGYLASLGNTYFPKRDKFGSPAWMAKLHIYGTTAPTNLSVDDLTQRMGKQAAQAFEDGWFDALEDNVSYEESYDECRAVDTA